MKMRFLFICLVLGLIGFLSFLNPSYAKQTLTTSTELVSLDSDKDGYSDLCEALHKTDANDKKSTPSANVTINVPSDVESIQEAINVAIDGDTIAVAEGTYKGNINFKGKSLTLTSPNPENPEATIIEGTETGSVVTIDSNSIIKGFTITSSVLDCRGIYIIEASPTIENCIIIDNKTTEKGAGIYSTENSSPTIINCIVTDNTGAKSEEQIAGGKPEITNSIVGDNLVMTTASIKSADIQRTAEYVTIFSSSVPQRQGTSKTLDVSPLLIMATAETDSGLSITDLTDGITAYDLAYALVGNLPGVEIFNVTYTGDTRALGTFSGGGTNQATEVGISEGVILSNGKVKDVVGPNISGSTSTSFGLPGDADLAAVAGVSPESTNDAAVLEFDFTTNALFLDISCVFGSEEYNEWVGQYNDLFGIFLNGVQYALISNDDPDNPEYTYIAVNTINNDDNSKFYRDNTSGNINCEMDGLTTVIDLWLPIDNNYQTGYGQGNHMKIVIADMGDFIYDSNVFLGKTSPDYADIIGRKWEDLNADGIWDPEEPTLAGVTIYLDLNDNGMLDPAEPVTLTKSGGIYSFNGLDAGTYVVREIVPSYYEQTFPEGDGYHIVYFNGTDTVEGINFGNYPLDIWYVDDDAPPGGDGKSWETAFKYLQDALRNPEIQNSYGYQNGYSCEIRVGEGMYYPDQDEVNPYGTSDRNATFHLGNKVALRGGYAGWSDLSNPNLRNITIIDSSYQTGYGEVKYVRFESVLSGDLDNNDDPLNPDFATYTNNSYHVITAIGTDNTAILDGFTITGGNATGSSEKAFGGGLFNRGIQAGSPTITNCIFNYNRAYYGGAVHNGPFPGSPPKEQNLRTVLTNCIFDHNTSREGGAINGSFLGITNCVFTYNTADANGRYGYGGAIAGGDGETTNCTFYGNTAVTHGGAICTGVRSVTITNSIFWGNSDDIVGSPFVNYCNVENPTTIGDNRWTKGTGNISVDPLFINADEPTGVDGIFYTLDDGLRLIEGSPCIDTANDTAAPATDITGWQRINIPDVGFSVADMGAYEYKAIPGGAIPVCSCQVLDQAGGNYYLIRDILGEEVTPKCINIQAEGITFDGFGYSIKNAGLEDAVVYSAADNVTIKNCDLTASPVYYADINNGYGEGIYISSSANHNLIENNKITDTFWGIKVVGQYNIVQNNIAERNAKGIHLDNSYNVVKNNLLKNNYRHQGWGLGVWRGEYNDFINNKVYGSRYGIVLFGASNTFIKCDGYANYIYDIALYKDNQYGTPDSNNRNVNAYGVKYYSKYIGSGAEFNEYYDDCDDVDCFWTGDQCLP